MPTARADLDQDSLNQTRRSFCNTEASSSSGGRTGRREERRSRQMGSDVYGGGAQRQVSEVLHHFTLQKREAATAGDNYSPGIYHSARQSYTPACLPFFLSFFPLNVSTLDKRGSPVPTFNKQQAPPPTGNQPSPPPLPSPALLCSARNQNSTREAESCIASRKSLFLPFKNVKNRGIRFSLVAGRIENSASLPSALIPPLFIYLFCCFRIFWLLLSSNRAAAEVGRRGDAALG